MTTTNEINDLFLAAAEIEAETPITVGADKASPDGNFVRPRPVRRQVLQNPRQAVKRQSESVFGSSKRTR
jgi:hypothetical protein